MFKKIAILIVLFLGAYMGAHFYILESRKIKSDTSILSSLIKCEPSEIKKIKIINSKGSSYEFERVDPLIEGLSASTQFNFAEWLMISPQEGEGNAQLINRLVSMVCETFNPIPIREADWKESLEQNSNRRSIEVQLLQAEARQTATLSFSKEHLDKTVDLELRVQNEIPKYFRIPSKMVSLVDVEDKDWKNLKITRMPKDSIQVVSVFLKNQEKFTLEREGVRWRIKIGAQDKGLASEEANKYVNRISTLKALQIKNPHLGRANCEALAKDFKIVFSGLNNKAETIVVNKDKDSLFVCSSNRDSAFIVHRDLLKYLPLTIK